ncbi:MAG: undecaprenyldiphospho-muramoylpentapeptide beta-N-acetylglucosaminyltransferase [Candidatus Cloacimonetes bacterium]|nr:undecaprenyldiphospho-muramoylpentapeptide beta-N-acetylglucosaminyltransferase [Candidatus Cloacimonadota bacterium]
MIFAFGAGGTGGHIIPALALAKELINKGHKCIFIGNSFSMEERLAKQAKIPFFYIKINKLYRSFKPINLLFPYFLTSSVLKARKIIKRENIDGVITTGGFVAGPVAVAAISKKIPCFLHESNSYPGITTKYLAKYLNRLYISFEESRKYLKSTSIRNMGIPIIKADSTTSFTLESVGLQSGKDTLLITGGSQGSLAINNSVSSIINVLLEGGWQILWQTGRTTFDMFARKHKDKQGLYIFDFNSNLTQMMHYADLAITRAGAITIAELEAAALPSILIPLPTASENHQYYNALAQKNKEVAELLIQTELSPQNLLSTIKTIDCNKLKNNLNKLPPNTAAERIVTDILSFF